MASIWWSDDLLTGIEMIDNQHRSWTEHLDAVARAIAAQEGPEQVGKTLDFLVEYTNFHFDTEEKFMKEKSYPGLSEHRRKHAELRKTLADLDRDLEEEGPTEALSEAVDTFLGNWLTHHIREVDMKFSAFLRAGGAKPNA